MRRSTHVDDGDLLQAELLARVLGGNRAVVEHAEAATAVGVGVVACRVHELRAEAGQSGSVREGTMRTHCIAVLHLTRDDRREQVERGADALERELVRAEPKRRDAVTAVAARLVALALDPLDVLRKRGRQYPGPKMSMRK